MNPWTCLSGSAPANQNSSPASRDNFSVNPVDKDEICFIIGFSLELDGVDSTYASLGEVKLFIVIRRRSL